MRVIKRTGVSGAGFNVMRSKGGVHPLMTAGTTKGYGLEEDFYKDTNVRHPFQSLGKVNEKNAVKNIKIKSGVPKRYISFNM